MQKTVYLFTIFLRTIKKKTIVFSQLFFNTNILNMIFYIANWLIGISPPSLNKLFVHASLLMEDEP